MDDERGKQNRERFDILALELWTVIKALLNTEQSWRDSRAQLILPNIVASSQKFMDFTK